MVDHKLGKTMVADDARARISIGLATLVPAERKGEAFACEIAELLVECAIVECATAFIPMV